MPKKSIEENEVEEIAENKIGENTEEPELKKAPETVEETGLALDSIRFTILRVDYNGFFGIDEKGNGMDVPIPKQYKNKELKAGDIIFISKSEL